jgi:V/A-type H+-transporting ATPase subunit C
MPQPSFPYAAGRVRALEGRLLSSDRIGRMLDAQCAQDAFKILRDTGYGSTAGVEDARLYEEAIAAELVRTERLIDEITPDPALTDVFIMRSDYHNAKAFIKMRAVSGDEEAALTPLGKVDNRKLEEAVFGQEYAGLPAPLAEAIEAAETAVKLRPDPRVVDMTMDRRWMEWALRSVRKDRFLSGYFEAFADFANLLALIRARATGMTPGLFREALLPGGTYGEPALSDALSASKEIVARKLDFSRYGPGCAQAALAALGGRVWEFEKFRDNYLTRYVRGRRWEHFTIEPVIAFLLAKEAEGRAVRLIMAGKLNGLPADTLGERLRELYA